MIEIKLYEAGNEGLTVNDLQWFQEAVTAAGGHGGASYRVDISDGKLLVLVPSDDND